MKKKIVILISILSLMLLLLSGCEDTVTAVYVQSVSELMGYSNTGAFNITAGVIMAQEEVKIDRDMEREIAGLSVEVGQLVNEGDVLFTYKTANISLEIDKVKLEIEQLKNSISDLKTQITQLEKEKLTALESEKLGYTLQIQSLQTDRKEQEYNLALKEKELLQLQNNTDTGEVRSPITGEVKKINEDGGYDSYTGNPLPYIVLSSTGDFRIKGSVNELNRDEFYVGQNVLIRSRIDSSMVWTGIISSIENQASDDNNGYSDYYGENDMFNSSSYPFYVTPNSNEGMLLGQHVFIEPDYGQSTAGSGLWLDASYIVISEEETFVWAADADAKIEKRSVELGTFDAQLNRYEILTGLNKADRIAFPGDEVQVGAPVTEVLLQEGGDQPQVQPEEEVGTEEGLDQEGVVEEEMPTPDPEIEDDILNGLDEELSEDLGVELPEDHFDDEAGNVTNGGGT